MAQVCLSYTPAFQHFRLRESRGVRRVVDNAAAFRRSFSGLRTRGFSRCPALTLKRVGTVPPARTRHASRNQYYVSAFKAPGLRLHQEAFDFYSGGILAPAQQPHRSLTGTMSYRRVQTQKAVGFKVMPAPDRYHQQRRGLRLSSLNSLLSLKISPWCLLLAGDIINSMITILTHQE